MPLAPRAMRVREEKRIRSCGTVGFAQGSVSHWGLACLIIVVSHNTTKPCNQDNNQTCKKFKCPLGKQLN